MSYSKIALLGIEAGMKLFDNYQKVSIAKQNEVLKDNKVSIEEYKSLISELQEHQTMIKNLISDTELDCKFKKTEEIFVSIIKIIMMDMEHDYKEVFENLNLFIDSEKFIKGHEAALEKRKERLNKEYELEIKEYDNKLKKYQTELENHKSKSFLKKMTQSFKAEPPIKPKKRE